MNPAGLRVYNAVCNWLTQIGFEERYEEARNEMLWILRSSGLSAIASQAEFCRHETTMGRPRR